jgi:hypothetical protein
MQSKTSALRSSQATKSVRNGGPIQSVALPEALAATMFMPTAVILAVGVDPWLSGSRGEFRQSTGYHMTPAESIRDAIDHIRYGDFDLVVMGDAIRLDDRERLAFLICALGSRVPVVCVTDSPGDCATFADATVRNDPGSLLQCIGDLLAGQAGKPVANRATSRANC